MLLPLDGYINGLNREANVYLSIPIAGIRKHLLELSFEAPCLGRGLIAVDGMGIAAIGCLFG
jgi:hypothetical protein